MNINKKQLLDCFPNWWLAASNAAARFAISSPSRVPISIRKLPLGALCIFAEVRYLILLWGYGGCAPHGDT